MLSLWKIHGLSPDYFCDSNIEKQGSYIEGIKILSPVELRSINNIILVATLSAVNEIRNYVKKECLNVDRFIDGSGTYSLDVAKYIYEPQKSIGAVTVNKLYNFRKCLFDFTYGDSLGGVQEWCYSQEKILKEFEIESFRITPPIEETKFTKYDDHLDYYVEYMKKTDAKYIIINFPREIMCAALLVKMLYKPELYIVAVIHNDEDIYYDNYLSNKELIDSWITISDRIENKIIKSGVTREKIHRFYWKRNTHRSIRNNKRIKIGYAGRIVIIQKRIDLIIRIARILKEREVDFIMEIAGGGESEQFLLDYIAMNGLSDNVSYVGVIAHDRIQDFWSRQDIYLSCSDYEGHSISQYEAMATGAVPVVTDTSGARDDVQDGYNGFVLPVGDVEGLVNKLIYLDNNKVEIQLMSERCIQMIENRNAIVDEKIMWKEALNV